ncbi:MAG: hypothetical protein QXI10_03340 [Candidatus Diapherotrites archaeon]
MGCSQQNQGQQKSEEVKKQDNVEQKTTTQIIKGGETKPGEEQVKEQVKTIADGIYDLKATYAYPKGEEKKGTNNIGIIIELENEVVKKAEIIPVNEPDQISKNFITSVNKALPELMVGKKITELNLPDQISGSSLTAGALKASIEGFVESQKVK